MRENEKGPQDAQYDEIFARLTEQIKERGDAGLVAFNDALQEIQKHLDEKYSNPNTAFDTQEATDIDEQLEEDWNHNGSIAHVSGRIYLQDEDIAGIIPEEWGNPREDENKDMYYWVDSIQLRSVGAEVLPTFDAEGKVLKVRAGYTFALIDDPDEMPVVCAFPDHLMEHRYDKPSPQEAIERLENEWPRQFEALVERISTIGQDSLPARLTSIVEELQEELAHSDDFLMLVETYLQSFVVFDQTLPYSLRLESTLEYYEGENPYLEEDKGEWVKLEVEGDVTLLGFRPKLKLERLKDETVHCLLIVATYNNEDGDAAEYVRFDTANATAYKSTRALKSLISRAVYLDGRAYAMGQADDSEEEIGPDTRDEVNIEYAEQETNEKSAIPEKIAIFEALENEFKRVRQLIKRQRNIRFETAEEATQAADTFVRNELIQLNNLLFKAQGAILEVSGDDVLVPNDASEFETGDEHEGYITYKYQIPRGALTVRLEPGDSLKGPAMSMVPFADAIINEDQELEGFRMQPSLLVGLGRTEHVPIALNDSPLVKIGEDRRMLVPLDGRATISIEALERYREFATAIDVLDEEVKKSTAVELIRALNIVLTDEVNPERYVSFTQTELFEGAADDLLFLEQDPRRYKQVIDLIETVLVGHTVQLIGEVYLQSENATFTPYETDETHKVFRGSVVDVRTDIDGSDIFLAIADKGTPAVYVRLRSIKALSF